MKKETTEEKHSTTNQRILSQLVEREVSECVSSLVGHFAQNAGTALEGSVYSWEEDILPLCEMPPDFKEAATEVGWEWDSERDEFVNRLSVNDSNGTTRQKAWRELCDDEGIHVVGMGARDAASEAGWEWDKENERFIQPDTDHANESDWEELCANQQIEPERVEVYEHWVVSSWFAARLEERGHPTGDLFDLTIWGRPTTGQAISLDGVIFDIASEMGILVGQENDWSKQ